MKSHQPIKSGFAAEHAGVPFLPGGFAGVDVFFVLSGYLISRLLIREQVKTMGLGFRLYPSYARALLS